LEITAAADIAGRRKARFCWACPQLLALATPSTPPAVTIGTKATTAGAAAERETLKSPAATRSGMLAARQRHCHRTAAKAAPATAADRSRTTTLPLTDLTP